MIIGIIGLILSAILGITKLILWLRKSNPKNLYAENKNQIHEDIANSNADDLSRIADSLRRPP